MAQKILVLEDDYQFARDIQAALTRHGYEVQTARLGSEAVAMFESAPPDLVVADMFVSQNERYTPDGGLVLIVHIRRRLRGKLSKYSKTPIVAISGGIEIPGGYSPLRSAHGAGADMTLRKPFPMPELIACVQILLDPDSAFNREHRASTVGET